jgi:hypothetical protein
VPLNQNKRISHRWSWDVSTIFEKSYACASFRRVAILCVSLVSASVSLGAERQPEVLEWPEGLPVYDHIVIVMEENKDYSEVIGNPAAAYINEVLKKAI